MGVIIGSGRILGWRHWTVAHWNRALAEHFFRQRSGEPYEDVTRLLVTPEQFARATVDATAAGDEAVDAFVNAVRRQLHSQTGSVRFCTDARDLSGWIPSAGTDHYPPFVSHLILSCFAVSLVDEDGDFNEHSILDKLDFLCGTTTLASHPPDCLPELWTALQRWLQVAADETVASDKRFRRL